MGHYQDFSMADILERVEFKRVGGRESAVSSAGNSSFPTTPPPLAQPNPSMTDGGLAAIASNQRGPRAHLSQSERARQASRTSRKNLEADGSGLQLWMPCSMDLLREEEEEETKNNVPRIQCGDGCDPEGLKDNSQLCLQRIHHGLAFYKHLLDSDIFKGEPALLPDSPVEQLHTSLLGLSQLLQPEDHPRETQQMPSLSPSQQWQRPLLRSKILRSLQAFLAIAARVFAHGAATLTEPLVPTA
ncbi:interleukin-23 subunit alpha isoform X1 [Mus pahari]|uniref:interleukin-23 subunit alpha isoform X1 n=1 Tax=Mus pahari TaxID=10093 RepID=UPI001114D0CD|nr:interleukin-23 subunit alpha isoform X1 [Mus pahari]